MSAHAPSHAPSPRRAVTAARRILVVEDTSICREPIITVLKLHGFEAIGAEDGQKALDLIAQALPDLIVLDISMPQMDGWTMLGRLRNDPRHAHIPVILLTATADRDWVSRALSLGVRDYLLKSEFSMTEMLARVEKCFARAAKAAGVSRSLSTLPSSAAPAAAAAAVNPQTIAQAEAQVLTHALALTNTLKGAVGSLVALLRQHPELAGRVLQAADTAISRMNDDPPDANLEQVVRAIALKTVRSIASGAESTKGSSDASASAANS